MQSVRKSVEDVVEKGKSCPAEAVAKDEKQVIASLLNEEKQGYDQEVQEDAILLYCAFEAASATTPLRL